MLPENPHPTIPEKEKLSLEDGSDLVVEKSVLDETISVTLLKEEKRRCLLHWGVRKNARSPWQVPPEQLWPAGSNAYDHAALQTPFAAGNGQSSVVIKLPISSDVSRIDFVLFFPDEGRWDNNHGRNYRISLPGTTKAGEVSLGSSNLDALAEEIIEHEMSGNSWTLMHRFNLCYDLLDKAGDNQAMALIFVWLRFSFIRQLDWQRNYNTKPRELGHSMDRLTLKLAERYASGTAGREMIRLVMSTLGRGGDAQRVRDEVLNIMHRHHIKEVSGHFMEEWHQKLHNNTTPDDVIICEGYLDFLRSNGNLDRFYHHLLEAGITKERLEGYERPIKSFPDFIPHLKDALIRDFEHFLGILKGVHSGTDLGAAIGAAMRFLDPELHAAVDFIWSHRDDSKTPVLNLVGRITDVRRRLSNQLTGHAERVRDLLFLDIALEDFLRVTIERRLGPGLSGNELVELISMILHNLILSSADSAFSHCAQLWERLEKMQRFGREWSLRARAVLDLISNALGGFIDRFQALLQPKAEFLGKAFHAESWAVGLFSEEVMRGRPAFALSMLARYLDPVLRKIARLGDWQVISRGEAAGKIEVVETLKSVQGKEYSSPVVIIADSVSGNEEIPRDVVAVLTSATVDVLSHIAVRARNAGVLFATCYDDNLIAGMKALAGAFLKVSVNAAAEVVYEVTAEGKTIIPAAPPVTKPPSIPGPIAYVIALDECTEALVGGKSLYLKRLKGKLPDWIGLPASVAIPFGVFERVLAEKENVAVARRCGELAGKAAKEKGSSGETLMLLRRAILDLKAPAEFVSTLQSAMGRSGLNRPCSWDDAWLSIKKVWASKWNDRAYLSRTAAGTADEELMMAVLIQEVVEADYSFVIHSVNPLTGNKEEIYGEAVRGLGEALVGNYPGRSLGFVCGKKEREPLLLSFPSKSEGLFGEGLIFRSDSNGEDLTGFAGAGLYDSFIMSEPQRTSLNYTNDPLFWDDGFRKDFLLRLAEIGERTEDILGAPQDIEGAYSRGGFFVVQSRPQVGL